VRGTAHASAHSTAGPDDAALDPFRARHHAATGGSDQQQGLQHSAVQRTGVEHQQQHSMNGGRCPPVSSMRPT
jgi:hypothetical protein